MKFESTPPRAADAQESISMVEVLKYLDVDLVAAETRIVANMKRIFGDETRGKIHMMRFQDLDPTNIHKKPLWVYKTSIGFSAKHVDEPDGRESLALNIHREAEVAATYVLSAGEFLRVPTVLDGLDVKLKEVGPDLYSISTSVKFTFIGE